MSEQRRRLRSRLRQRRAEVPARTRQLAALRLASQFLKLPAFRRARHVAFYCALGSEIDVWPLVRASLAIDMRVYLPRVHGKHMHFVRYRAGDVLCKGAFGISEPAARHAPVARLQLDWVIVPLLGFDSSGNRIGQGGGFYDRAFTTHRHKTWRRPLLAGVAFDVQHCDHIDTANWDVSLDLVVTQTRVYRA